MYPKFSLSVKCLADYLSANESKTISAFHLNNIGNAYGIFSDKKSYFSYKFINAMKDSEIITIGKENNYENINLNIDVLSDDVINLFIYTYKSEK